LISDYVDSEGNQNGTCSIVSESSFSATDLFIPKTILHEEKKYDITSISNISYLHGTLTLSAAVHYIGRIGYDTQNPLLGLNTSFNSLPQVVYDSFDGLEQNGILVNRGTISSSDVLQFLQMYASLPLG
jgi:hypothetical protein